MSAARRIVVGVENDDGSTVIWRFTSVLGELRVDERFDMYLSGNKAGHHPHFMLDISGYGERIDSSPDTNRIVQDTLRDFYRRKEQLLLEQMRSKDA